MNENHDDQGRFSSGPGGGGRSGYKARGSQFAATQPTKNPSGFFSQRTAEVLSKSPLQPGANTTPPSGTHQATGDPHSDRVLRTPPLRGNMAANNQSYAARIYAARTARLRSR